METSFVASAEFTNRINTLTSLVNELIENEKKAVIGSLPFKIGDIVKVHPHVHSNPYILYNAVVNNIIATYQPNGTFAIVVNVTHRYKINGEVYMPTTDYNYKITDVYPTWMKTVIAKAE